MSSISNDRFTVKNNRFNLNNITDIPKIKNQKAGVSVENGALGKIKKFFGMTITIENCVLNKTSAKKYLERHFEKLGFESKKEFIRHASKSTKIQDLFLILYSLSPQESPKQVPDTKDSKSSEITDLEGKETDAPKAPPLPTFSQPTPPPSSSQTAFKTINDSPKQDPESKDSKSSEITDLGREQTDAPKFPPLPTFSQPTPPPSSSQTVPPLSSSQVTNDTPSKAAHAPIVAPASDLNPLSLQIVVNQKVEEAFVNGKHGKKTATYTGDWLNGKPHGKGLMIYENAIYEGDFVEGEQTGVGKIMKANRGFAKDDPKRYENCETYEGGLIRGEREGYGEFYLPKDNLRISACLYKGQYHKGLFHGFGLWFSNEDAPTYARREVYIGYYKSNKCEGQGVLLIDGEIQKQGIWKEDTLVSLSQTTISTSKFSSFLTQGLVDRINDALMKKSKIEPKLIKFDISIQERLNALKNDQILDNILKIKPEKMNIERLKELVHLLDQYFQRKLWTPEYIKSYERVSTYVDEIIQQQQ